MMISFSEETNKIKRLAFYSLLYLLSFLGIMRLQKSCASAETLYLLLFSGTHFFTVGACGWQVINNKSLSPSHRWGWASIGGASLTYLMGSSCYAALTTGGGQPPASPSCVDAFWLLFSPCLIVGLLLLSDRVTGVVRARLLLDSAITTGSLASLLWYFLIQYLWHRSGVSVTARCISIAYPLEDALALFAAVFLLNSSRSGPKIGLERKTLALAIACWSISDLFYGCFTLHDAYHVGSPIDTGWMLGGLLLGVSARLSHGRNFSAEPSRAKAALGPASGLSIFAPYLALCGSMAILFSQEYRSHHQISPATLLLGVGLLLLVMLRQVLSLLENRQLTETVSQLNSELGLRVQQRTLQLDGLLNLTRHLSNSVQIQEVITTALQYTRTAFRAQATLLWLSSSVNPTAPAFCHQEGLENEPDVIRSLSQPLLALDSELFSLPGEGRVCLRVPIVWYGELLGMLGILYQNEGERDANDLAMLTSMASEVGAALSNAYQHQVALENADCDAVTGLFNHRAIQQRLETAFDTAFEAKVPLTVMLLDVTNFRLFNETHGHRVGDSILRSVGGAILETLPTDAYVGRFGGDEYLAVLLGVTSEEAVEFAEQLQIHVSKLGFQEKQDDRVIPVFLACGIASSPRDCGDRGALLTLANENLQEAKQHGERIRVTGPMHHLLEQLRADPEFETLDAMVTAVDNKDSYTRRHSEDMTQYALWIAEELEIEDEETLRRIRIGGLLHDVGKIGVPANILCKPGRLTEKEYETLKRHPRLGALIVGSVPGMETILDAVRSHHERWDGGGYPNAAKGQETPWLGRLMAVADAFSAMTTDRPYRKGLSIPIAVSEIEKGSGTQFDPEMAAAFLKAVRKRYPPLLRVQQEGKENEKLQKAA